MHDQPDYKGQQQQPLEQPIMSQLYARIYKDPKSMLNGKSEKPLFKNPSYDTFSRSSSKCSTTTLQSNNWFTDVALSPIDRVHFIVGYAILRPSLRDETYAQLIKQLTNNPKELSCERGWLLFSLVLSSFQPSAHFECNVKEFIDNLNEPLRESLTKRYERCADKGVRRQPPSYLEFQVIPILCRQEIAIV